MLELSIGLALGLVVALLGAGGGILAVPLLMGGFGLSLQEATGAGLAVVFAAALTSALGHARARRVDWRTLLSIGPTSMLGAVLGAKLHPYVPPRATEALFALVLVAATASLFRPRRAGGGDGPASVPLLVAAGLALGVLTGFLGVGGGFLLVPALTGFGRLPMQRAVGTSTSIIALSSFAGGATALVTRPGLASFVLPLAVGAVLGALFGVPLAGRLPERVTRAAFATLALTVAAWMAWKAVAG